MKKKLTAITVCLCLAGYSVGTNTAQASIFGEVRAAELTSQPKVKSVFTGSPATTEEQTHNVNNANGNTPSAGAVFNRKYGTTAPMITTSQGMVRQDDSDGNTSPMIELKDAPSQAELEAEERFSGSSSPATRAPLVQGASSSSTTNTYDPDAAIRAQLEATQAELKRTRQKLEETTSMYGDVPADAEKLKSAIPSVPKSVMTNVPKYGDITTGSTDLKVRPGVNQIITISTDQPNRIITPFNNPQILSSALQGGKGKECGEVCVKGNVVYVSTKKDYPLGLFITEKGNEQTAISLTLVPRRIPPREVNLVLNDSNSVTLSGSEEANVWETSQPFVNTLKKTLLAIALGEVPSGYHLQKIPSKYNLPVCNQSGLKFDFSKGQLMAGVNLNYTIGKVTNVSNQPIELIEASCGGYDVAAVAAYPYNLLKPNQSTEIYVVQRINSKANTAVTKRRSLLN